MTAAEFELLRELQAAKEAALLGLPLPASSDPRLNDPDQVAWLSLLSDENGLWCLVNPDNAAVERAVLAVAA